MSHNSLMSSKIVSYWKLNENAGNTTVADGVGSNTGAASANTNTFDATGPNSYLPGALDFNGTNHFVNCGSGSSLDDLFDGGGSVGAWIHPDSSGEGGLGTIASQQTSGSVGPAFILYDQSGSTIRLGLVHSFSSVYGGWITSSRVVSTSGWQSVAGTYNKDSTSNNALLYRNGSSQSVTEDSSPVGVPVDPSLNNFYIGNNPGLGRTFNGRIAGLWIADSILNATEISEMSAGPEPVNTIAPVLSGTETEGETLSVTNGTWALPAPFSAGSNGTITYNYQWTRSDDAGGTNEANIAGAASSTYTLQAADVGKFIRAFVRGTNDGGADTTADTFSNMSGEIAGGGGGATGASAQTLPSLSQAATGNLLVAGAADQTLPALTQSAAAGVPANGTAQQTLPGLSQAATAAIAVSGQASLTLPAIVQATAGSAIVGGDGASLLPSLSQSAAASVLISGAGASLLPSILQRATNAGPAAVPGIVCIEAIDVFCVAPAAGEAFTPSKYGDVFTPTTEAAQGGCHP